MSEHKRFSDWWALLSKTLVPGTTVQHWSADKGLIPGTFVVHEIEGGYVRVEGPEDKIYKRMIGAEDFRKVLNVWPDYCRQIVSRKTVDRKTIHSTYVIGIIRWLDINSK